MSRQSKTRPPHAEPAPESNSAGPAPSIGFPPIARADARLLILGSLPGAVSLARREYYAQPQNSFWPILGSLLGFDHALAYDERTQCLLEHRIALWDVCRSGVRLGSLDSAIRRETILPNDFGSFLPAQSCLCAVAFNGRAAESLYRSLVLPTLPTKAAALPLLRLPSTSPAYASLRFAEKLAHWRVVLDWLA